MNARRLGSFLLAVVTGCNSSDHSREASDAVGEPIGMAFRLGGGPAGRNTSLTLNSGNWAQFVTVPFDTNHHAVSGFRPTIRSRNRTVADVDSFSRVLGRTTGKTYVVAWITTPTRVLRDSFEVVVVALNPEPVRPGMGTVPMPRIVPGRRSGRSFKIVAFTRPRH